MNAITGKTDCSFSEAGYDGSRIEQLHTFYAKMISDKRLQGVSYCLTRKGKVFASGALGKLSFREENTSLMQPDSIFRIASITKMFTSVAIMKLVEDGTLRLDNKVGEILPQFSTSPFDNIKIYHLLSHTSGLHPSAGCFPDRHSVSSNKHIMRKFKDEGPEADWISAGLATGLRRDVGTEWQYCSFGFLVLGAIIEKLSGVKSAAYIEDNIIKPLSLNDTTFGITPETAGRTLIPSEWVENDMKAVLECKKPEWPESAWTDIVPPTAGGIYSTAYDLARFGNMLLANGTLDGARVLGRKSVEKMTTNILHNIPDRCWRHEYDDRPYGMGVDLLHAHDCITSPGLYFHEGAGGCALVVDPAEEMVAAWCVPFVDGAFQAAALYNARNIMWSGIL